ncbi:DUF998 domain-containing protein [Streptomyces sp. NPDC059786]|uniref:DUF998 domain-containing protein n=1 Tax=Streptomyces sp. NPDC059786 TaxID=3346946 RepID=UPI0036652546
MTQDRPRRAVALLLTLGTLTYSAWALEAFLPTNLPPTSTYVSELAALDQPDGALFRTTDLIAGMLLSAAALTALRPRTALSPRTSRWETTGWSALTLFGAATAADSRLPMSCAPTMNALCARRERAGALPLTHQAHAASSMIAMCAALAALASLTYTFRHDAPSSALSRYGPWLALLALAATAWTLTAIAHTAQGDTAWLGTAQRLQLTILATWLLLLARRSAQRSAHRR